MIDVSGASIGAMRPAADEVIAENIVQIVPALRRLRRQMDHPDFLRWVAGKLGAF